MLSKKDRVLIKMLRVEKGYGAKRVMAEFPRRNWSLATVKRLLQKIDATGSADRKAGSGRRRIARTDGNVNVVEELALSQESAPGTHRTVRQIARETGITKSSVNRIVHRDLKLKCFKKEKAQDLTETNKNTRLRRYTKHSLSFIWFTDEKLFRVASPVRRLRYCQLRHLTSSAHWIGHRTVQMDYAIWGILRERVYDRCQIRDVDHLKERLIEEWRRFDQNLIDRYI